MHSLQHMILDSPDLPASANFLCCQPCVNSIRFISCPAMSHDQVQNMVLSLPAMQRFIFQKTRQLQPPPDVKSFAGHSLAALIRAPHIRFIDLEGAQGLTFRMICAMDDAARAEQASRPGRQVKLVLPNHTHQAGMNGVLWQESFSWVIRESRHANDAANTVMLPCQPSLRKCNRACRATVACVRVCTWASVLLLALPSFSDGNGGNGKGRRVTAPAPPFDWKHVKPAYL